MDNDPRRKLFLWGMGLAWIPSVPLVIGVFRSFRGISEQKATGLGAIAGGVTEVYLTFGLILTFIFLGGAIVLLSRSFAGGHPMRATLSVLSMCWSALIFSVLGLLVWLFLVQFPRGVAGPQ
jgi:hypothetical protein